MKKGLIIVVAVLVACFAMVACAPAASGTAEAATEAATEEATEAATTEASAEVAPAESEEAVDEGSSESILIGLSVPSSGWPYYSAYLNFFEEAVSEMPNVEAIVLSADADIQKQANDINDLIVKGVDILMFGSLDGEAIIPALKKVSEAGIPLLAVTNEPAEAGQELLAGYVGADDKEQGKTAARMMAEALGGKGNVVVLEGTPGQFTTLLRSEGFEEELAVVAPDITILDAQTAHWDPSEAKAVTQAWLTKYGDQIDGIFSQDDNTAASVGEVVRDANLGKEIIIIGTGGSTNGLNAVRNGLIYGTEMLAPSVEVEMGLEAAVLIANGGQLEEKRTLYVMPEVTAENVDQFEGEW